MMYDILHYLCEFYFFFFLINMPHIFLLQLVTFCILQNAF